MKAITFLAVLLFILKISVSQTWISDNAVWHYNYENFGVKGFHKIEYIKDTLILGELCQYLQVTDQQYSMAGPPNWGYYTHPIDTLPPRFTFMRNDTVFYYNDDMFSILYCMNAAPGQSWDLGIDTNWFLCSKSIVNVEDVFYSSINGQDWPTLFVSPNQDASTWLYGRIVTRLGSFDNYLFPQPYNCDSTLAVEFSIFYFSCFKDDDFPLVNRYDCDCDNPLALGIGEAENTIRTFSISPNPASTFATIQLVPFHNNSNYELLITDLYGKKIEQVLVSSESLRKDVSNYPAGIYIVSMLKEGSLIGCQKLIKH